MNFVYTIGVKKRRKKTPIKPQKPPKYLVSSVDEGEDFAIASKRKINRDIMERRGKDDGDESFYHMRLE